jgi:hypothetical protein
VTGVNPTFVNVVNGISGQRGTTVVDGRNNDNGYRFDECDGDLRSGAVLNQCDAQSPSPLCRPGLIAVSTTSRTRAGWSRIGTTSQ